MEMTIIECSLVKIVDDREVDVAQLERERAVCVIVPPRGGDFLH